MPEIRGYEVPTIDCALITITAPSLGTDELTLDTASQIALTPVIDTQDAITLIVKGILRSQKPAQNVLTGNTIVLTDNVFNPQLVKILQGGTITIDEDTGRLLSYTPPVAGAPQSEQGEVFQLHAYTAIYSAAGILTGYEKITYPNCQGTPVALSSEDDVFRVPEYTINSAPEMGQPPYTMEWIYPNELPVQPNQPDNPLPPPEYDSSLTDFSIGGLTLQPAFDPEIMAYIATTDVAAHTVEAIPTDSESVITYQLNNLPATTSLVLVGGVNVLEVVVTNHDSVTTYRVDIDYEVPETELGDMTITGVALTPTFDSEVLAYTGTATTPTSILDIDPPAGATVDVTLNGTPVVTRATYTLTWVDGSNAVAITVNNGDQSKTYTVTVDYTAPVVPDARLESFNLTGVTLDPAFDSDTMTYTGATVTATATMTATPIEAETVITATLAGSPIATSSPIEWAVGENTLVVTCTDGSGVETYTFTVTYTPDTRLSSMEFSGVTLDPTFDPATTTYTGTTADASCTLTAVAADTEAVVTLKVNDTDETVGSAFTLTSGSNTAVVTVTNDTATSTYTTTIEYTPA